MSLLRKQRVWKCGYAVLGPGPGGCTHISEWHTSATKHLRHKGLSVTGGTKKIGGLSVTDQRLWGLSSVKRVSFEFLSNHQWNIRHQVDHRL